MQPTAPRRPFPEYLSHHLLSLNNKDHTGTTNSLSV